MIVYELSFWYFDENTYVGDELIIAVYSSKELAEKAMERFKKQPRFIGHENDFYISKYRLNQCCWPHGFILDGEN